MKIRIEFEDETIYLIDDDYGLEIMLDKIKALNEISEDRKLTEKEEDFWVRVVDAVCVYLCALFDKPISVETPISVYDDRTNEPFFES